MWYQRVENRADFGSVVPAKMTLSRRRKGPVSAREKAAPAGSMRPGLGQSPMDIPRLPGVGDEASPTEVRAALLVRLQIPVHRGQSFQSIADSVPVIADSF